MAKMHPPYLPEVPVPVVSQDEMRRLLATCKGNGFYERRDAALIRVLFDCGLRASELVGMKVGDVDFEADCAHVMGEGSRPRAVPFGRTTGEALRRYRELRIDARDIDQDQPRYAFDGAAIELQVLGWGDLRRPVVAAIGAFLQRHPGLPQIDFDSDP